MKKALIILTVLLLCGCSTKESESSDLPVSDSSSVTSESSIDSNDIENSEISSESEISETDSELNSEEILAGDFSSIAGEYINPEGEVTILNETGLKENEIQTDQVYLINGVYFMGINHKDALDGGYQLTIFPVGVEVLNLEGLTDTTKIRICYGQAEPLYINEVYTKK